MHGYPSPTHCNSILTTVLVSAVSAGDYWYWVSGVEWSQWHYHSIFAKNVVMVPTVLVTHDGVNPEWIYVVEQRSGSTGRIKILDRATLDGCRSLGGRGPSPYRLTPDGGGKGQLESPELERCLP